MPLLDVECGSNGLELYVGQSGRDVSAARIGSVEALCNVGDRCASDERGPFTSQNGSNGGRWGLRDDFSVDGWRAEAGPSVSGRLVCRSQTITLTPTCTTSTSLTTGRRHGCG